VAKPERYVWEEPEYNEAEDEFMKHFDENGNFIEHNEMESNTADSSNDNDFDVKYNYKENKDQ